MGGKRGTPFERMIQRVVKQDDGCWIWQGATKENGYGVVGDSTKKGGYDYVHRVSYEHHFKGIPSHLEVRHSCDVRNCVNPQHLDLGTKQDNMDDMVSRGRSRKGSESIRSKITESDVLEIRRRRGLGETLRSIGDDYGLCFQSISLIARGKRWRHVTQ